ncbi:HTH-type transcriptional regulator [Parasponia andersonii]|uniref:HTH-type transcriptional regulator n=1 Tax=Parasponia andersonii TaxID=3476 RepID=A0A2P5BZ70_PARAD|nr:HTH-type transcriptional regulator [Parasponia andersonii]
MGICSSANSTHVATAKLILQDGRLQEFSYPVKVSYVLQRNPSCFICNSDEMDFDDVVSAVNDDEELRPGQLYFALPLDRLRHRLQPEDMAALAVKASSALMKSGGGKCVRRNSVSPIVFSGDAVKSSRRVDGIDGAAAAGGGSRRVRSGGRRKFTAMLSSIPE